jgi:hypothetical protein
MARRARPAPHGTRVARDPREAPSSKGWSAEIVKAADDLVPIVNKVDDRSEFVPRVDDPARGY